MSGRPAVARRLGRALWHRSVGRLFFVPQRAASWRRGPVGRAIDRINQSLNESGAQPPWIYTRSECAEFWATRTNDSASNRPEQYAHKQDGIVRLLHEYWSPEVGPASRILEIGCNCGANLNALRALGYGSLQGVEINPDAVRQMARSFPGLERSVTVHLGHMAEVLPSLADGAADVVFTMGVSMHIHPKDNHLFAQMARVASAYVCTVEPELANSNYVFARDYGRVFTRLGLTEVRSLKVTAAAHPQAVGYSGCTIRLFRVGAGRS